MIYIGKGRRAMKGMTFSSELLSALSKLKSKTGVPVSPYVESAIWEKMARDGLSRLPDTDVFE